MINIISAIGSMGTFIMAIFYFVSVSIQLYQLRIGFKPSLSFNQVLIIQKNKNINIYNTSDQDKLETDYIKLVNLGGGAAKKIKASLYINTDELLQDKYINFLPSNEGYLLPINKDVNDEIVKTIENEKNETSLFIEILYMHNVSRKTHKKIMKAKVDEFNTDESKNIYELQFEEID